MSDTTSSASLNYTPAPRATADQHYDAQMSLESDILSGQGVNEAHPELQQIINEGRKYLAGPPSTPGTGDTAGPPESKAAGEMSGFQRLTTAVQGPEGMKRAVGDVAADLANRIRVENKIWAVDPRTITPEQRQAQIASAENIAFAMTEGGMGKPGELAPAAPAAEAAAPAAEAAAPAVNLLSTDVTRPVEGEVSQAPLTPERMGMKPAEQNGVQGYITPKGDFVDREMAQAMAKVPPHGFKEGQWSTEANNPNIEDAEVAAPPPPGAPPAAPPAPAAPPPLPAATPAIAAADLAQRQIDKLKAVRVGQATAEEFGRPDIAAVVPEELTMQESQALRQNVESYYAQSETPPDLPPRTQALASVYQEENQGIHDLNTEIRKRAALGEDVTADLDHLVNRWAAFAENYSTLAGSRSAMGRGLEILSPNKPGNAAVAETAKLAQQLTAEVTPQRLSDLLANVSPEALARIGRQQAADVKLGRSLYDAFNEYYVNNLLSNAARTSARIGTSNAVSAALTIPEAAIQSVIPGSGVPYGAPLARIQGLFDGFWHATDVGIEALKTGGRESQIEGGSVSPLIDQHKAITGEAFGLDGTNLGMAIDYLGAVLRAPGRLLTGIHQFGHSMATSMETHQLAWTEAVNQAKAEGVRGFSGYNRAQDIYHGILNDLPDEMRMAASKSADVTTFANALEKDSFGGALQKVAQFPVVKQLMPFFKVAWNVQQMGMDITPGLGTLTQAPELLMGTAKARSAAVAKQAFGALLAAATVHEYHQGNIQLDQYGTPYFRLGGKLIEVPEPLRFPIGFVGNYIQNRDALNDAQAVDKATEAADAWTQAQQWAATRAHAVTDAFTTSTADSTLVQTLVNIKKLRKGLDEGDPNAVQQFGGELLSGLVPFSAVMRATASGIDPIKRDPKTVSEEIKTGIPVVSQSVQPKYDMFMRPLPNRTLGLPEHLIYPVQVMQAEDDPVVKQINRLGIKASYPPKFLNDAQATQWQKDRADGLYDAMSEYVGSKDYQSDNDQQRAIELRLLIGRGEHQANLALLSDPVLGPLIQEHKLAVKGLTDQPAPPVNEFNVEGPRAAVPPISVQ